MSTIGSCTQNSANTDQWDQMAAQDPAWHRFPFELIDNWSPSMIFQLGKHPSYGRFHEDYVSLALLMSLSKELSREEEVKHDLSYS